MPNGTLLCLGFYPYDAMPLITAATAAHERLGLDPLFVSVAPPRVATEVRGLAEAAGFTALDRPLVVEEDPATGNLIERARQRLSRTRALIDDLLDEVRPAAILATVNDSPGIFLDRAAKRGIPTIFLQMVHWGDRSFYRQQAQGERSAYLATRSRRGLLRWRVKDRIRRFYGFGPYVVWDLRHATIAVQGPALQRRLAAEGVPSERIAPTGNPLLDDLHRIRQSPDESRTAVRRQLAIAENTPILTQMRSLERRFLALDRSDREAAQIQTIGALRDAAPEAAIVVKMHPREDSVDRAFVQSVDENMIVVGEDVSTDALLAASDLVISTASTTLLHTVLLDRPTVSVWLWSSLDYLRRVTDWTAVDRVYSTQELTVAARRHLTDPDYQEIWRTRRASFIEDEFLFDGLGTTRVVNLIDRMIRASHGERTISRR